jgi:putative ABC transport system permease protein
VLGLSLGFTAFILIGLFVQYDLTWDKTNINYDRIYRVQRHYTRTSHVMDGNDISPHTPAITAQLMEKQFPDFEKITVVRENKDKFLASDPNCQIYDGKGILADSSFFSVFTYRFLEGEATGVLTEPFTIVLSKTLSGKLFPGEKALGRTVTIEKKIDFKVTGVFEDLPENSSLRPTYIVSFPSLEKTEGINGYNNLWCDCMTYALLKPGINYKTAESKIKNVFKDLKPLEHDELQLCPMSRIFLSFNGRSDYFIVLTLFGLIGTFILMMSGFNYINMTTANSSTRGKEVALKKICGSSRFSLMMQFLCETLILSIFSLMLAFLLTWIFLPVFSMVVEKHLDLSMINNKSFIGMTFAITFLVGCLSGIYPALFLSSQKIVSLMNGSILNQGKEKFNLKKVLVTIQFAISSFLILITLSFSLQIKYLSTKDLGFKKENLLFTKLTSSRHGITFEALKSRLLRHPEILKASMAEHLPFVSFGGGMINWEGAEPDEKVSYRPNWVSHDFVSTLGAKIVAGRDFSPEFRGDLENSCLINESAAKCFGWKNPIGKRLNDNKWTVVGVLKDYSYKDMHNGIEPAVLLLAPNEIYGDWSFAFRIDASKEQLAKSILTREFEETFPNDPFEFQNLSTTFLYEKTFRTYHSINSTLMFFAVLNVFLAVIGLLGLVSYTVARRTKEIGIRKINGSTPVNIFYLLSREYFILLIPALLIAFPSAYLLYSKIPGSYKLPQQPWVYLTGAGIIFIIILLVTSYQTFKAATRNPVEALRHE